MRILCFILLLIPSDVQKVKVSTYADGDHEETHQLNSQVRNKHPGFNACYLENGISLLVPEPPVKLSDIANNVPHSLRGLSYNLYLISQQVFWNNEPCYVLDEWSCYLSGFRGYCQRGDWPNAENSGRRSFEFLIYSIVLVKIAEGKSDTSELCEAIRLLGLVTDKDIRRYGNQKTRFDIINYLAPLHTNDLKNFIIKKWGAEWSFVVLGIQEDHIFSRWPRE